MKSEKDFVKALKLFCNEVGAPKTFIVDTHPDRTKNKVRQFFKKVGTTLRVLGEFTQHADRAEVNIGLMKSAVGKDMREANSPMRLLCYACERRTTVMTLTAKSMFQL